MKKYNAINGLRTIACLGIVLLHVKINMGFQLNNNYLNQIIDFFAFFVFLFMIISAFGMCCGYYNKIKGNTISMDEFYKKRFKKILPFFSLLVLLDIIIEHSISALIEGFADITLMFGFLPKKLEVIGVAWYLGLVCVFYMIFPFFVYLLSNRKKAWFIFIISLFMNMSAIGYFNIGRTNMFYSFVYFVTGGLLFLYKDNIEKIVSKNMIISIGIAICITILYFFIPSNKYLFSLEMIIIFTMWMGVAIGTNKHIILDNVFTKFISRISLEIYLSHMIIFRVIEKLGLTNIFGNNWQSYIFTSCTVIIGVILISIFYNKVEKKFTDKLKNINSKSLKRRFE